MVRWACRAERFVGPLRPRGRGRCRTRQRAFAGPTLTAGVRGGVEVLALALERRKFRAGDDGEVGAGSGGSHTNAAAETVEGSGPVDGWAGDESAAALRGRLSCRTGCRRSATRCRSRPRPARHPAIRPPPARPRPRRAQRPALTCHSRRVQSSSARGETGADADRPKVKESRPGPMLSAGSAGTSASAPVPFPAAFSSAAELPLAGASLADLAVADLAAVRTDEVPRI